MSEFEKLCDALSVRMPSGKLVRGLIHEKWIGFVKAWDERFVGDGVVPLQEFIDQYEVETLSAEGKLFVTVHDRGGRYLAEYYFDIASLTWTSVEDEWSWP